MDLHGCCRFAEILELNHSKMNTKNMMEDKNLHIIFATLRLWFFSLLGAAAAALEFGLSKLRSTLPHRIWSSFSGSATYFLFHIFLSFLSMWRTSLRWCCWATCASGVRSQMHHCLLHHLPFWLSRAISVVSKDPLFKKILSYLIWCLLTEASSSLLNFKNDLRILLTHCNNFEHLMYQNCDDNMQWLPTY
jgi:hypothetical protein